MARRRPDTLERDIENALRPGSFVSYRASWDFTSRLHDVAQTVESLVKAGEAARAASLYEIFIAACHEKADEIDDSSGGFGDLVEDLFCGWLRARRAAGADPTDTTRTLLAWMEEDPYGFCHGLEKEAVKCMDKPGLAAFERATRARYEAVPEGPDGQDPAKSWRTPEYSRRRWAEMLRAIYAHERNIEAYAQLCEQTELTPDDCEAVAGIYQKKRKFEDALAWVERGLDLQTKDPRGNRGGWDLPDLRRKFLRKVGRGQEALESAWAAYAEHPHECSYKDLMAEVPKAERADWHRKAMEVADGGDLSSVIGLWLSTKEIDRLLARLKQASDAELEGLSHYCAEPAMKRLAKDHPDVAARLHRAMGMRILAAKKSNAYGAALSHLGQARKCYANAGLEGAWDALVEQVRQAHHRKHGFMAGFEDLVSGARKQPEPSFLERARRRWPRKRR